MPSLDEIAGALRAAGRDVDVGVATVGFDSGPAVLVPAPGGRSIAIQVGTAAANGEGAVQLTFHEDPWAARGHPFMHPVGVAVVSTADEAVRQVEDWLDWERTWSVPPPGVDPARRRRLEALAAARRVAGTVPLHQAIDPLALEMLDPGQRVQLERDLERLFTAGVTWHFPRDGRGRLARSCRVLLRGYGPPPRRRGRAWWLVVDGPRTWRAPDELTLRLDWLIGENFALRWDGVPERWLAVEGPRPLVAQWGLRRGIAEVEPTLRLQDQGQLTQAMAEARIGVEEVLGRLLTGLPAYYGLRHLTEKWTARAAEVVRDVAPWRLARLGPDLRPTRLAGLGGLNQQRRPGVFLAVEHGRPRLSVEWSASNAVVPAAMWERPADLELVRAGLVAPDEIPTPGR
jgi:hypothetical protein